jgi:anti-sigma regulatory factor (Ser/Thr protein kinase)
MMQQVTASLACSDAAGAAGRGLTIDRGPASRHVRLAALPSAAPWARRVLRPMLREWQLATLSDPAMVVVSELVTNAVQAGAAGACPDRRNGQIVELTLLLTQVSLRIEVWDANPAVPVLREADLTGDRGRGLVLVDFMTDGWGYHRAGDGKVVWCEITIPPRAARRC